MPGRDIAREDVLRMFNYGLYVAASIGPDGPRAATLSWVTQVSFEPQARSRSPCAKAPASTTRLLASRRFALHVVGKEQADFAKAFFKAGHASERDAGDRRLSASR